MGSPTHNGVRILHRDRAVIQQKQRLYDELPELTELERLIDEGKPLPAWHHLISGDREMIHRQGGSIMGRTLSEDTLFDPDDVDQIEEWIVDWDGNEP